MVVRGQEKKVSAAAVRGARGALTAHAQTGMPAVVSNTGGVGAANAAAGLAGMPAKRYLPALAIGGLAWAVIYATVGLVAVVGWFELVLVSPWGAVAVLALVVALVAVLLRHKRRTGGISAAEVEPSLAARTGAGADHKHP